MRWVDSVDPSAVGRPFTSTKTLSVTVAATFGGVSAEAMSGKRRDVATVKEPM